MEGSERNIYSRSITVFMREEQKIKTLQKDLEAVEKKVSVIMHILSNEGELSSTAKKRLEKARKTPLHMYKKL